jgi:hypothetical protein
MDKELIKEAKDMAKKLRRRGSYDYDDVYIAILLEELVEEIKKGGRDERKMGKD